MQTNLREAAVRCALAGLIDYAGLFPPAKLDMRQAVAEYRAARAGAHAWMLGKFIVPLSRAPELLDAWSAEDALSVSAILDGGIAGVARIANLHDGEPRLSVESLEIRLEPEDVDAFAARMRELGLSGVPSYVEFPRDARWREMLPDALRALAAQGLGAKIRCGGLEAKAFPSPAEVALFVQLAVREGVPFKATAGLHHPVRGFNAESGFTMHGFLNLLAAAAIAQSAPLEEVEALLACEDSRQFAFDENGLRAGGRLIAVEQIAAMRRSAFVAYGSCSFREPVEDLQAMGVPV